jgi:hypothetical protein
MKPDLSKFENKLIDMLLAGNSDMLSELRKQYTLSTLESREVSVVGFYLNFKLPANIARVNEIIPYSRSHFCFGGVGATIPGLISGAGFLVWVVDGFFSKIEGYTYGDDELPKNIDRFKLRYYSGRRNIKELEKKWKL